MYANKGCKSSRSVSNLLHENQLTNKVHSSAHARQNFTSVSQCKSVCPSIVSRVSDWYMCGVCVCVMLSCVHQSCVLADVVGCVCGVRRIASRLW